MATTQTARLVMLRQIAKVELMYRKWYKSFRKCWFWQRRNFVGWTSGEACQHEHSKCGSTNDPVT